MESCPMDAADTTQDLVTTATVAVLEGQFSLDNLLLNQL